MTTHITSLLNSAFDGKGRPLTNAQVRTARLSNVDKIDHPVAKKLVSIRDKVAAVQKSLTTVDLTDFSEQGARKHLKKLMTPHLAEMRNLQAALVADHAALTARPKGKRELPKLDEAKATRLFLHFRDASKTEQDRMRNAALTGENDDFAAAMAQEPFLYGLSQERHAHLVARLTEASPVDPQVPELVAAIEAADDLLFEAQQGIERATEEKETEIEMARRLAGHKPNDEPQPNNDDQLNADINRIIKGDAA